MLNDIISVITDAHYLELKTIDGRELRCRMTMSQFTEQTNDSRVILVNKGVIINADHIVRFENNCCITDNGVQFPICVRDSLKIMEAFQNYNFDKIRGRRRCGQ